MVDKETGIWGLETAKKQHRFDEALANKIASMYMPKKVADLGCGIGEYCKVFREHGWRIVHGYEGTQDIQKISVYKDIFTMDLTKIRYVNIEYDFVLCIEVGEHIPKEYEQIFMDNVARFACKDLILSWGIPGQGGTGHFNEQSNGYIVDEFYKRKFKIDRRKTRYLRSFATLSWFKGSLMVFYR